MTPHKLRAPDLLAGLGGLGLLLVTFAPWYGVLGGNAVFPRPGGGSIVRPSAPVVGQSAWQSLSVILALVVILAALGMAIAITTLMERSPAIPVGLSVFAAALGSLVTLLVLFRLLDKPGDNGTTEVRWGALVGLALTIAVTVGGWWALREDERPDEPQP